MKHSKKCCEKIHMSIQAKIAQCRGIRRMHLRSNAHGSLLRANLQISFRYKKVKYNILLRNFAWNVIINIKELRKSEEAL